MGLEDDEELADAVDMSAVIKANDSGTLEGGEESSITIGAVGKTQLLWKQIVLYEHMCQQHPNSFLHSYGFFSGACCHSKHFSADADSCQRQLECEICDTFLFFVSVEKVGPLTI